MPPKIVSIVYYVILFCKHYFYAYCEAKKTIAMMIAITIKSFSIFLTKLITPKTITINKKTAPRILNNSGMVEHIVRIVLKITHQGLMFPSDNH